MRISRIKSVFHKTTAALLLTGIHCPAEIIPANRRMDWTPGSVVGVPGGIRNRTVIFVNVKTTANPSYRCKGDGITDDTLALQAAMKACPPEQVVYVPEGRYKLDGRVLVQFRENFTLRGAGQGKTIFLCTRGGGSFELGTQQHPTPSDGALPVTAGATVGSTVLTVSDASTVNIGNLITLRMDTPKWMHTLNGTDAGAVFKMTFKVQSKTTTRVTISPRIPFDVSSMNPKIVPWGNYGSGHVTDGVGFEDFTINATDGSSIPLKVQQAWGCWFKGIEIVGTKSRQMFFLTTCSSEVRDCYLRDTQGGGPNHEGIDFVNDGCWNLIENNICVNAGYPAIILGDGQGGCVGNVIAYNYVDGVSTGSSIAGWGISDSHGAGGNSLNLFEGNVSQGFASDGYFGGSSYGTLIRNHFHNKALPQDGSHNLGPVAVMLCHYAVYYNVVGNVLGSPDVTSQYESEVRGGYRNLIYRLGYPNCGNGSYGSGTEGLTLGPRTPPDYSASPNSLVNAQALDLNVKATLLRHGNFDYTNNRVLWDPSIVDHNLPPSLYLSAKPAWWDASSWPPIGPDVSPMVGKIPAETRFLSITSRPPAAPTNPRAR